jgi:plasmid replication initiation protein
MEGAIDALLKRVITTREDYKGRPAVVKRPLMFRGVYEEGKGRIIASFHPDFVTHLIGLRQQFASYPLAKAVNFKSSYTWRLFEIMVSWSQDKKLTGGVLAGWFTVSVEELRKQLGMPESYLWVNVDRTLEASVKELQEKANIHTKISRTKTSRKITHLKFEFVEDLQQDLLVDV